MTAPLGPSLEIQGAIVATLNQDGDVQSLLGSPPRIYQTAPAGAVYPYLVIGEGQTVPDLAECIDGSEVFPQLHFWSKMSFEEAKRVSAACWAALRAAGIALTENRCLALDPNGENAMRDPDGVSFHVILTLRVLTEPA